MKRKPHRGDFTSKMEALNRAKRRHVCLDCCWHQPQTFKECPQCGSQNRQYFMSEVEHKRGMLLLTMQRAGTITRLRFQPRYDLVVNGQKVGVYTADVEYYEAEKLIVEDTKPEKFMDDLALLKIKLFEAIFGLTVKIPQRKSGNRSAPMVGKTLI